MPASEESLLQIAKVLKSNGTDGEIVLNILSIAPEDIRTQEPVYIIFDGLPVPFFIESISFRGNTKTVVRLTDIACFEDAEEIVGRPVYVRGDAYEDLCDEDDFSFLVGWTLFDGDREVGEITDFIDIPSNPCIEVRGTLVPLHDDLVAEVDSARRIISMNLPAGLLD